MNAKQLRKQVRARLRNQKGISNKQAAELCNEAIDNLLSEEGTFLGVIRLPLVYPQLIADPTFEDALAAKISMQLLEKK